jgi:hypothetical protein
VEIKGKYIWRYNLITLRGTLKEINTSHIFEADVDELVLVDLTYVKTSTSTVESWARTQFKIYYLHKAQELAQSGTFGIKRVKGKKAKISRFGQNSLVYTYPCSLSRSR